MGGVASSRTRAGRARTHTSKVTRYRCGELMGVRASWLEERRKDPASVGWRKRGAESSLVHGGGQNIDLWGGLRGWCPRALHPRPPTLS